MSRHWSQGREQATELSRACPEMHGLAVGDREGTCCELCEEQAARLAEAERLVRTSRGSRC